MSVFIGIDVSKATLDVATHCGHHHLQIDNSTQGYHALDAWLAQWTSVTQIALEASGRYGEAVVAHLIAQGYAVSYINPKQIHNFARLHLHQHKTDKQDAKLIARYCQLFKPDLYHPSSDLQKRLQQRSRRLDQLKKMRQQEVNRAASGLLDDFTLQQIHSTIAYFDTLIQQTQQAIHDLIHADPQLKQQHRLLTSIKGIGDKTAQTFLAEINIHHFNSPSQLAAYLGITPQQHESGTSVKKRAAISKQRQCAAAGCSLHACHRR